MNPLEMIDPNTILSLGVTLIGTTGLAQQLLNIGWALLVTMGVINIALAVFGQSGLGIRQMIMRIGIGAVILSGTPTITTQYMNLWQTTMNSANSLQGAAVATSMTGIAGQAGTVVYEFFAKNGTASAVTAGVTAGVANPIALKTAAKTAAKPIMKFFMKFLIPVFALYSIFLVSSGLTALMLVLTVPLIAGFMTTDFGPNLVIKWLSVAITNILTIAILPIIIGIICNLLIVGPINQAFDSMAAAIPEIDTLLGNPIANFNDVEAGRPGLVEKYEAGRSLLMNPALLLSAIDAIMIAAMAIIVAIIASIAIFVGFEKVVAGLFAGMASSAGLAMAGVGITTAAFSGGGGGGGDNKGSGSSVTASTDAGGAAQGSYTPDPRRS